MAVETDQRDEGKPYQVAVVPITHVPHHDPDVAKLFERIIDKVTQLQSDGKIAQTFP